MKCSDRELNPERRRALQYKKILYGSAAMSIAAGRNPAANLLDMLVFATLSRMVVQDYWVPKVYGPQGQKLLATLQKLEKEVWSLAGEVLTSEQQQTLRNQIQKWRAAHPDQYYVADVRLLDFAKLRGESPEATEKEVHGLLGEVEKALLKFDEAFLLAERAMFYFERMPRIVTLQTELIMDQITNNPEVEQLLGDVKRVTQATEKLVNTAQTLPQTVIAERQAALKQLTDWLDQERQKLMADLEGKEAQLKGIVVEARQALTAGNELVKSVDAFYARVQAEASKDEDAPPVDYVKALEKAGEAARHFRELVLVMDAFVAGEEAAAQPASLAIALEQVNAQTKALMDHAFLLAAGLILMFLVGLVLALLCYRYLASRLVGSSRG